MKRLDGLPRADKGTFRKYDSPEEKQTARREQKRAAHARYRERNKELLAKKRQEYFKRRPEVAREGAKRHYWRNRDKIIARKYGLTEAEFAALAQACEICGSTKKLCVDHCHGSGRVRGRLCDPCNSALGLLRDDQDRLRAALAYLDKCRADARAEGWGKEMAKR